MFYFVIYIMVVYQNIVLVIKIAVTRKKNTDLLLIIIRRLT